MSDIPSAAAPFGKLERTLAWRYLRTKREHGGASLISIISFVGIFFAVAALIITMSIMSGFRATLLDALLGGQPHVYGVVASYTEEEAEQIAETISLIDGVSSVLIELFKKGKTVIVSSLDLSATLKPFEEVEKLLPWATKVKKCPAVCVVCGRDAFYTYKKNKDLSEIAVGGSDLYEPRCWHHHDITSNNLS